MCAANAFSTCSPNSLLQFRIGYVLVAWYFVKEQGQLCFYLPYLSAFPSLCLHLSLSDPHLTTHGAVTIHQLKLLTRFFCTSVSETAG